MVPSVIRLVLTSIDILVLRFTHRCYTREIPEGTSDIVLARVLYFLVLSCHSTDSTVTRRNYLFRFFDIRQSQFTARDNKMHVLTSPGLVMSSGEPCSKVPVLHHTQCIQRYCCLFICYASLCINVIDLNGKF